MKNKTECKLSPGTSVENGSNRDHGLKEVVKYLLEFGYIMPRGIEGNGSSIMGMGLSTEEKIIYCSDNRDTFNKTITLKEFRELIATPSTTDNYLIFT